MSEENKIESKIEESIQYGKVAEHLIKEEQKSLEDLLKENLEYMKAVYADTQKIRRSMFWRSVISWVWIILFVAPLILSLFYLPNILGGLTAMTGTSIGSGDLQSLLNQLK